MTEPKVSIDIKPLLEEEFRKRDAVESKLRKRIKDLKEIIRYERERREYAEKRMQEAVAEAEQTKRKRRTKAEMEAARQNKPEYSEYKSNGVKKKGKVSPISSYTDFKKIQDYFLEREQVDYYVIWTVGVCMGVRASDIVTLKWKNIINDDHSYKERIKIYEQKTSKLQNCLITDAMKEAFTMLLNSKSWNIDMEDYIFPGGKPGTPLTRDCCYKNIRIAAVNSGIRYPVGTHTMRASFANIVLCVDKSTIDMNAITKIQGLLNHSDPRVTMRYLGKLNEMYDKAREAVSDFVLGKSGVDELVCGTQTSMNDLMDKLNDIEHRLAEPRQ